MLAIFSLRLAAGMLACLLFLPPALLNPRFYRTHFLTALALACLALLSVRDTAAWQVLALLGGAMFLSFVGSLVWGLEEAPGGQTLIVLTTLTLAAALAWLEIAGASMPTVVPILVGDLTSSLLLGSAVTAMLIGHSYLIAPTMSLTPLVRLLAVLAVSVVARLAADGYALGCWTAAHSLVTLKSSDAVLWLPLRWLVGFLAPLALDGMAWQTARIRSTQSATGILYVVVIFCFLGELTSQLLRDSGMTL
jgi:hypothetical protein